MYTDEEILYHAFKISQTRDDQLIHANWTRKVTNSVNRNISDAKDDSNYWKAQKVFEKEEIEKYIDERAKYYVNNTMPKNIEGITRSFVDVDENGNKYAKYDTNYSVTSNKSNANLKRGIDKWLNETKVKILDDLHKKFNAPRNPYITRLLNDYVTTVYIDDALNDALRMYA